MKQVNFTHPGGFPLEQETLEKLQTAYRHELFGALKSHLGINPDNDYIIAPPINAKEGWAIIHPKDNTGKRTVEGILYPIKNGTVTLFLKTTRTGTNLTYGNGESQTAYFDYEAQYISDTDYANRPVSPPITDALAVHYYDLSDPAFITIKDIQTIEGIIKTIEANITTIKSNITTIEGNINAVESNIDVVEGNINTIEANIVDIKKNYLLIKGSELNTSPEDFESSESSENSLLLLDNVNQVIKSNNLLNSLLSRITKLEKQPATAVPKGMIAIWGKPAPFPEGWEEYVPLRGRVPVGLDLLDTILNKVGNSGGSKDAVVVEHSHDCNGFDEPNTGINALEDGSYKWGLISKTTTVGESGTNKNLQPYRVVHFIEYTGNTIEHADTIAPTSPTNLETSKIGTKSLTLTWTASTDNVGVTNYLVYKDNSNTPLAELGKDVVTYNVTGLSVNTPYSFQVRAKDAAGNLSVPATVTTATLTADSTPPTLPSFFHCVHNGQGYILLEWAQSQDDDSPIDYELSRSAFGSLFTVLKKNPNTYYSEQVSSNGTYTYRVRAIDPSGNASAYKEASVTISSL
ncbi:hypothetical protein B0A79_12815 [Flavobacterium piscis]|uniref:Fibronectin type-III domain-containing protein n=1 Tax=Flavobacterium piscis TaxID=1114874 RepID=A0ABX2XGM5_9FLAO|nr:fibronectin type III domain-containing protein [Flavobacterium piscis]OCB72106.1 hypothetical protein FLP_16455 [Flavobacterium piscis]OXG04073.1 hypothetical protein B0A79_12815 [Flavobacterium piscis]